MIKFNFTFDDENCEKRPNVLIHFDKGNSFVNGLVYLQGDKVASESTAILLHMQIVKNWKFVKNIERKI